jgi:hypothetical protein
MYIIGYVLITFMGAGLQVQPVQLQSFKTQAECAAAADEARAFVAAGGKDVALTCLPKVRTK